VSQGAVLRAWLEKFLLLILGRQVRKAVIPGFTFALKALSASR